MVDFHTHILPGVDDGSRSVDESIKMLRMQAQQGITHVVATPHFYANHHRPEEFLRRREEAEKLLREEMKKQEGLPELLVGAEVYYFPGMSHSDFLLQLTIRGTKYIMIEMPGAPWGTAIFEELEMIHRRLGLIPIIAHLDRYIAPFRTHGLPERLAKTRALVQVNGSFFLNRNTVRMALRMLKKGQIQLLGSDCHDPVRRKPNLQEATTVIEQKLGREALAYLTNVEETILSGVER